MDENFARSFFVENFRELSSLRFSSLVEAVVASGQGGDPDLGVVPDKRAPHLAPHVVVVVVGHGRCHGQSMTLK